MHARDIMKIMAFEPNSKVLIQDGEHVKYIKRVSYSTHKGEPIIIMEIVDEVPEKAF